MENTENRASDCPRALYYALDVNPRNLFELRCSVESVRRHAPTLQIYAVLAGVPPLEERAFLDSFGVTVIDTRLDRGVSPMFLKWRALAELPPHHELLYLDTDTLAFDNPMRLFDLSSQEDFHARPEVGCELDASAYPYLVNFFLMMRSQIDQRLFLQIAKHLRARLTPVFNTGVMLFRNACAQRLANCWKEFRRLERRFRRKQLPYPCNNAQLLNEVIASLVFGGIETFTWAPLSSQLSPYYIEYRARDTRGCGIILHAWSAFYAGCLFEFIGKDEALAYEALRARDPSTGFAGRVAACRLLLGSTWLRLPKPLLEAWLHIGLGGLKVNSQPG